MKHELKWLPLLVAAMLSGCGKYAPNDLSRAVGGNARQGKEAIARYGCSGCHVIPGLPYASLVGPSLAALASRNYVGGVAPNTPENLVRWIQNPQALSPHTAMPTLYVSEPDARDIAAYLYGLK